MTPSLLSEVAYLYFYSFFPRYIICPLQGLIEELPTMNQGRTFHSCGSYKDETTNKMVRGFAVVQLTQLLHKFCPV